MVYQHRPLLDDLFKEKFNCDRVVLNPFLNSQYLGIECIVASI